MSESDNTAFGDEVYVGGDDDAEYLDQAETLTGEGAELDEPLDTSYSPPDNSPVATRFGNTAAEQAEGESLDQRLAQEVPDITPDDVTEDAAPRAGRLIAPDEGAHEDVDGPVAFDAGKAGSAATAEEAAMHIVDEDDLNQQATNEDDLTADPVDDFR
ncbi:MAG TPA: DUF5709 domain-containing protein [Jatrophihabitans sp.]|jgi:hypothetical protein|uniref:DUF5709 domain-containing protein n=1 Tax=Jatrophihabitans sp. TaxID=1932789 RepID=UPI002F020501